MKSGSRLGFALAAGLAAILVALTARAQTPDPTPVVYTLPQRHLLAPDEVCYIHQEPYAQSCFSTKPQAITVIAPRQAQPPAPRPTLVTP